MSLTSVAVVAAVSLLAPLAIALSGLQFPAIVLRSFSASLLDRRCSAGLTRTSRWPSWR